VQAGKSRIGVRHIPYIHFTDDQKRRAGEVDLEQFLLRQGEKLLASGFEKRLASDNSITIRGNRWYDHAAEQGGGPISFVQQFYNLSYPEAVTCLLGGEQGVVYVPASKQKVREKKAFALPPANRDMRRMYAYLLKNRFLDRDVISAFVRAGVLYESCEKFKGGTSEYHNVVFVGKDTAGTARHAHKRSINSIGKTFRINVEGSDPRCSFHHTGSSERIYVFEAPIDLLSFITLYRKDWQRHSYVALCGTAEHAMLWMLEQNSGIRTVCLCLDHDATGIEAGGRLTDILWERGYDSIEILQSEYKDWNEDIKAQHGLPAQAAEEHPQLIAAPEICGRIGIRTAECTSPNRLEQDITSAFQQYERNICVGRPGAAMDQIELASALALSAYNRELRQMGELRSTEELVDELQCRILPHRNRGNLKSRRAELAGQLHSILERASAPGIRSKVEKQELADSWLYLAVSFAKVPVKYEADLVKQQQKQEQRVSQHEMTMTM
jgi:hypothetical protein